MKIGIVGLSGSGKSAIFNCLTGVASSFSQAGYGGGAGGAGKDANLRLVPVPDVRLTKLSEMYKPKKTTPAQVQYVDVAGSLKTKERDLKGLDEILRHLRPVDALIHVVRCFSWAGTEPHPVDDYNKFEEEMIFSDLIIVERRLERLSADKKRGKKIDEEELGLIQRARDILDDGRPLREEQDICLNPRLKGYAFLSSKPVIVCLNIDDENEDIQFDISKGNSRGNSALSSATNTPIIIKIKGAVEQEILELSQEEQEDFRREMGIEEPSMYRLIRESYKALNLISFFTVGDDEVRAWTIRQGTGALRAAGVIHSDIERGFIRAEVVHYDDLIELGSYAACQKAGKVRLEGKEYIVKDGDIIHFRFNI